MTHPLTEKIVEAVKQAAIIMEEPENPSKEGTIIDLPVKVLRTAIQSVLDGEVDDELENEAGMEYQRQLDEDYENSQD